MQLTASFNAWLGKLTAYFMYLLLVGTLGPFLFGFHLAELNAPQDVVTCAKKSIRVTTTGAMPQCIPMGPTQLGLVSSIFTLGGLIGALAVGPLSAKLGRLVPMRLTTGFFILGPVAEALAPNVATMAVGRFLSGLGAGASLVVVPIWISEIAPPDEKGFFGAFTQIMTNTGIFTAQFLGYFLSYDQMWRVILASGGLIGLLQLAGLTFAVDSPKWSADHGNLTQAKEDLRKIRGRRASLTEEIESWHVPQRNESDGEEQSLLPDHNPASRQPADNNSAPKDAQKTISFWSVIGHPRYRRAVIVVAMVMVAQQFCGINSIVMYGVSLLSDLLESSSALLNIFVSVLNVLVTTACAPLPDKIGRKSCLLGSITGMGVSSVLLGIGIKTSVPIMSAVAVILFVASFGFGLGPVPFILSAELVGPEAVGATQSWALAANWISTFVVAQFFPLVNTRLGKGNVYFLFAGFAAVFLVFVSFWVPETNGKRSMDEVWGTNDRREE